MSQTATVDADVVYPCDNPRNYHEGTPPSAKLPSRQLFPYKLFHLAARVDPRKTALIIEGDGAPDYMLSFAETGELVRKMASGLRALGVNSGEVVSVLLGNSWLQLPLWLAVARVGGVYMSASRYLTRPEIMFQLDECRPRLVIGDFGIPLDDVLAAATEDPVEPFANEDAACAIRFSSGTTGQPKMMTVTNRAQACQYPLYASEMQITDEDVHYCCGPLAHAASMFALTQLFAGGTTVMKEKYDKETLWKACARYGITNTMVVPTMVASALEYEGEAPTLRKMTSLGAPMTPTLKRRLLERFPNLGLFDMYGSSETGMATSLRPHEQLARPGSAGKPRLGMEVRIFDDDGKPLPLGEVGTIYARGMSVVEGIIGSVRPKPLPENLVREGWVSAGDLGRFDEDGFLFISDRRVDLILSGGLNVYPAEVEATLSEAGGVRGVVVVGLPDERWGQRVTAYVEGEGRAEDLLAICKEKLASYKHHRAIHFVEELPRTAVGKTSRKLVRDAVADNRLPS